MLDKPKHYEDINKAISSVLQDPSLEKPFSVLHSCLPSIFALSMQCSSAKFVNVGFNPFGLGQWTIVLKGGLLLVCVQGEHVEDKSYAEKVSKLMEASPDSMHKMITEHGFFMHCTAGAAAWVPPGFFCMCISLGDATWLKWHSLSASSAPELRAVLSSCTQMISSYPVLQLSYKEWMVFLEASLKTSAQQ
eukprot:3080597-Pyramimonas_sp.AAC.1